MTPLTHAAVMTEQQLQEIERLDARIECPDCGGMGTLGEIDSDMPEDRCQECDGTGDVARWPYAAALIAEVRRLQQAERSCDEWDETAAELAAERDEARHQASELSTAKQEVIDALAAERDAAITQRDAARRLAATEAALGAEMMRHRDDWRAAHNAIAKDRVDVIRERDAYRAILAGVHGALMDAGSIPVPDMGDPLDEAMRALTAERDKFHRAYTEVNARSTDAVIAQGERVSRIEAERDAALAERDHYKGIVERDGGQEVLWIITRDATVAALTEARRVLRQLQWSAGEYDEPLCPKCRGYKYAGHQPACALAAVLAQEGK